MAVIGRALVLLVAGVVACAFVDRAYAAPGDLDPSFGTAGLVTTEFETLPNSSPFAAAVRADGGVVVIGYAAFVQFDAEIAVAQYEANGTHDTDFSTDGRDTLGRGLGFATATLPDGRVLISGVDGYLTGNARLLVARFAADGSFDATFGAAGVVFVDLGDGAPFSASGLAVQTDGKIVVGTNFGVLRLEEDGDLDATFGGDGIVDGPGGFVAIQPDDKIVVANTTNTGVDFQVARYESNGALDPTFGVGGVVTTDIAGGIDTVHALALQGSAILVAGAAQVGSSSDFALVRYDADGDLDATFSSDGKVTTDFGGSEEAYGIVLRDDGRIVAVGTASGAYALARYETDGDLDPTFDGDGRITRPAFAMGPFAVAADGQSRAIVGGSASGDGWTVGRILLDDCSNGTLDPGEACDGGATNGTPSSCCTSECELRGAGAVCRAVSQPCDVAETCTGATPTCPADLSEPDGTACDDGDACTHDDTCAGGACTGIIDADACIDDYLCYKSRTTAGTAKFAAVDALPMVDGVESGTFDVQKPVELCAPAAKNGVPAIDDGTHQLSYALKAARGEPKHVKRIGLEVTDSFGTLSLDTVKPDRLLAPAGKALGVPASPPAAGADHYKCYKVRVTAGTPKVPTGTQATIADQFENRVYRLVKPTRLCFPASIEGDAINHAQAHVLCYAARAAAGQPAHTKVIGSIHTSDRFGPLRLDTVREAELCVPATVAP